MRTLVLMLAIAALPFGARAGENQSRDAGKHFQRGVDLYGDGDFRGALVEFKKAYSIWPRANVLYDIGQTEYQLLDYAAALRTMERYLAETGAAAPHRQEVEATVEVLRGRVGRVALTTEPSCDVSVDDQPAGLSPLDGPLAMSVGLHTVSVSCAGRTAKRRIEVAGGETQKLELHPPPAPASLHPAVAAARDAALHKPATRPFVTGWIVSGVLAGATIGFGVTALVEQSRLNGLRATYPVSKSDLDRQQSLTTGLAITSDILGAASVVAIGVSTYLTLKYERDKRLGIRVGMRGVQVAGSF